MTAAGLAAVTGKWPTAEEARARVARMWSYAAVCRKLFPPQEREAALIEAFGVVDIDPIRLAQPSDMRQLRAALFSGPGALTAAAKLFAHDNFDELVRTIVVHRPMEQWYVALGLQYGPTAPVGRQRRHSLLLNLWSHCWAERQREAGAAAGAADMAGATAAGGVPPAPAPSAAAAGGAGAAAAGSAGDADAGGAGDKPLEAERTGAALPSTSARVPNTALLTTVYTHPLPSLFASLTAFHIGAVARRVNAAAATGGGFAVSEAEAVARAAELREGARAGPAHYLLGAVSRPTMQSCFRKLGSPAVTSQVEAAVAAAEYAKRQLAAAHSSDAAGLLAMAEAVAHASATEDAYESALLGSAAEAADNASTSAAALLASPGGTGRARATSADDSSDDGAHDTSLEDALL
jgi:hypothetical protein